MESTTFGIPLTKTISTQEQMSQQQDKVHQLEVRVKELLDENLDLRQQLSAALGNQCGCPE